MKQIFLASTFFQVVCVAAGIDSGAYNRRANPSRFVGVLDESENPSEASERILLVTNNAMITELTPYLDEISSLSPALSRFDRVIHLNELIAPNHPSSWRPGANDLPILERLIREHWALGDETVELVLESPQVNPAIALARIFGDASVRVHSDGLMSYGPTRNQIPLANGQRMTSLHYLPLVEGLEPRLLNEYGIEPQPLDSASFLSMVDEIAAGLSSELDSEFSGLKGDKTAFAVGQFLSALGLLTPEEEEQLHISMIREAASRGFNTLVFKPHPAAPPTSLLALGRAAEDAGIELRVYSSPVLAEVVLRVLRPGLVIGCFSTALATARALYGIPALALGTTKLLDRISPFQNSNRIPATLMSEIADGSFERLSNDQVSELQKLVDAVSYCMLPEVVPHLRDAAVNYLAMANGTHKMQYFKKRRLMKLGLPGGLARRTRPRAAARKMFGIGYTYAKARSKHLRRARQAKRITQDDQTPT